MFLFYIKKTLESVGKYGVWETARKVRCKLFFARRVAALYGKRLPQTECERQRTFLFKNPIRFSILTPLYNTDARMLREMLDSVLNQTYENWELCLADGSDAAHGYVERIVCEYACKDARIRYKKLTENCGISGNTNETLKMATGDYISLLDHDDLLHQSALFETMRVIDSKQADLIYTDEAVFSKKTTNLMVYHFKSDYAPDTLRSHNYFCHFLSASKKLYDKTGGFRGEYDGSQDYDMILRLTEVAQSIHHIPQILYFWRAHKASTAFDINVKKYAMDSAKKAIAAHLERTGLRGTVTDSKCPSIYRVRYDIEGNPRISILIPNTDTAFELRRCITSILERSAYRNFQIVIMEHNSAEPQTAAYYTELKQLNAEFEKAERPERITVVPYQGTYNYSAIMNHAVRNTDSQYLVFLNGTAAIISTQWLSEMLMFCQRSDVGAVGAMVYYPNDTVQHAGIIVNLNGGAAGRPHRHFPHGIPGYAGRLNCCQNMSAVSGACLMTKRSVFDEVCGLDENLINAYNDIDFCLKVRQAGYSIVWTPFAELYDYIVPKRRSGCNTPSGMNHIAADTAFFKAKWQKETTVCDPYYNPNFDQNKEDFSIPAKPFYAKGALNEHY